jgi:L-asparaginase
MKIVIITTGGTIDKIYFDRKSQFEVGEPQIAEVLREANITIDYDIIPLIRKDSLDLTMEDRLHILETVNNNPHEHFVITHGTDSMIETGKVLRQIRDKTIVLTGAMQPAKFRFTDAVFNIGTALAAVQILDHGVYIAMNGKILTPDGARKNIELNRFEEV